MNLIIWNCILKEIVRVNNELQKSDILLNRSVHLMEGLKETLLRLRNSTVKLGTNKQKQLRKKYQRGADTERKHSDNLKKKTASLASTYFEDLNVSEFTTELEVFKEEVQQFYKNPGQLDSFELLRFICENDLQEAFLNVCIALRIYITLPTMSTTCERSFSKLKLVKNYLR
ncbi:hypothetical protein PR048_009233 [Dryococelus australis]|uniref:HAT C-terminal dimerisation domain-containing protein n=1 Tax=Dryococelus australis TaxID=614101 RepID=A0ABQ9HZP5_9NEOP|nr:hypothetical protein PR048_009233 [Dryococelus australis]